MNTEAPAPAGTRAGQPERPLSIRALTRILRARERPLLFQRTVHFVDTNCAALGTDRLLELATSGSFGLTLERCEDAAFLVFENSAAVLFLEGVALQHGTDPLNSSH